MNIFSKLFKDKSAGSTLILDPNGPHQIGGKPAEDFHWPSLESSPMVYLGCLKKADAVLKELDFDLHMVCPIFIDLQHAVFFDYTNPVHPLLIRENVASNFEQLFDDIPPAGYIEYQSMNFRLDTSKAPAQDAVYPGEIGHTGLPNWIQDEAWPLCPLSGRKMKFLFQLGDIDESKCVAGQEYLAKEYIQPYLHFGHGYLYLFYEPESKVLAYINQV